MSPLLIKKMLYQMGVQNPHDRRVSQTPHFWEKLWSPPLKSFLLGPFDTKKNLEVLGEVFDWAHLPPNFPMGKFQYFADSVKLTFFLLKILSKFFFSAQQFHIWATQGNYFKSFGSSKWPQGNFWGIGGSKWRPRRGKISKLSESNFFSFKWCKIKF